MPLRPHLRPKLLALALGLGLAALLGGAVGAWYQRPAGPVVGFHRSAPLLDADARNHPRLPSETGLLRWRVPSSVVSKIFPIGDVGDVYDPETYFRHRAHVDQERRLPDREDRAATWRLRTNSLGLRDDELRSDRPGLRVLMTGDSHSEGVCDNEQTFASRLERDLAASRGVDVECINAAKGGFSFYNYLGVLDRFRDLDFDVFVVTVYGGNDFSEVLTLRHYFHSTPRPSLLELCPDEIAKTQRIDFALLAQAYLGLKYFDAFPSEVELALSTARDVMAEIQAVCRRRGVELLVAYLPSVVEVQAQHFERTTERMTRALGLSADAVRLQERLAERFLADLQELGVRCVDLRPAFREAPELLYWWREWHIDLAGHELVARCLRDEIERALPPP